MPPNISSDRLERAVDSIGLLQAVEEILTGLRDLLGVEHIIYSTSISSVDPTITPLVRSTFPAVWLKRYIEMSYEKIDPVLRRGYASALPFRWSEVGGSDPATAAMMGDAARHGVGPQGLSIPVVTKTGRRGLFSISSSEPVETWDAFVDTNLSALREVAYGLHKRVTSDLSGEPALHLSARELECLTWCARGKEAGDIAIILGISPHTVRDYLKSMRYKLNCSNLPQAVAKGIALGFIAVT